MISPPALWAELRERHVIRVAAAYAIAAWVVIEVVLSVAPVLGLPEWAGLLVVVLALVGLVPAVTLAWAFDRTAAGIRRAGGPEAAAPPDPADPATVVGGPPASEGSIAVLPFVNFSASSENEYFSDGITEELIDRLVKVRELRVAARTSSFAFKGMNADVADIGRRLRVAYVLEGSVRRAGDRLRVTAQLIDAATGFHLWSETWERPLADVFAIQDEIGRAIVAALREILSTQGLSFQPQASHAPTSVQAFDLCLQGRYLLNRRTAVSMRDAIERFELALACDAHYARAHAGLAEAYLMLASGTHAVMAARDALIRARASAARATELDPGLAEAHTALGLARMYGWDWEGALIELERATRMDPGSAPGHHHYAWRLAMTGHMDEALAAIDRAIELDPLSLLVHVARGRILQFMGRPVEAMAEYRSTLQLEPSFTGAHLSLGLALLQSGRNREAVAALQRAWEFSDTPAAAGLLAYAFGAAGDAVQGGRIVADLLHRAERQYVSPATIAGALVGLGRLDDAMDWYERAYLERSPALIYLGVEPLLDPLRSDPRFRSLRERVGLGAGPTSSTG